MPIQLVDGLQRLTAVRKFMDDKLEIFDGYKRSNFTDNPDMLKARFHFHVNDLETRAEILKWYLEMNDGGTIHTDDELEKVRKMLKEEESGE